MKKKSIIWMTSFALTCVIICTSVLIAFRFQILYDIISEKTNLYTYVDLSKEEVQHNYRILINYLMNPGVSKLLLPSFAMSTNGEIHFEEVKEIIQLVRRINLLMMFLLLIGIYKLKQSRDFVFLKYAAISSIALPVVLGSVINIDLDKSFVIFHELFFQNDYWIFDPSLDPVILILPEEVFYGYAFLILFLIALSSLILFLLYRLLLKHID